MSASMAIYTSTSIRYAHTADRVFCMGRSANTKQLPYQPDWNNGVDKRQYPGLILRAKLPGNATKSVSFLYGSVVEGVCADSGQTVLG